MIKNCIKSTGTLSNSFSIIKPIELSIALEI